MDGGGLVGSMEKIGERKDAQKGREAGKRGG